jgi:hypothetical protein
MRIPVCTYCNHKHYSHEPHVPATVDTSVWTDPRFSFDSTRNGR